MVARGVFGAVVSAVGKEGTAVFFCPQPLVFEVPDEPSLQARLFPVEVPILFESAQAVAHGVCVLALNQGAQVLGLLGKFGQVFQVCIHGTVDVGVPFLKGPFVGDVSRRVHGLHAAIGGVKIDAIAGFVAQRPADDGGVVSVSGNHALGAGHMGFFPKWVVAQRAVQVVSHAMRLNVGFIDHVKSITVAQGIPIRVVRVMGSTNGVEVVRLEGLDVRLHGGAVHHMSSFGVVLVSVDPFDENGASIDQDQAVFNSNIPEPHLQFGGLDGAPFGVQKFDGQVVQLRGFGCPSIHIGMVAVPSDGCRVSRCDLDWQRHLFHEVAIAAELALQGPFEVRGSLMGNVHAHGQRTCSVVAFEICVHHHIGEVGLGQGLKPYVALDPRDAPEVLAFEKAAIAPSVDFQRQGILPFFQGMGDVEFSGQLGALRVSNSLPVHPHKTRGFDGAQMQDHVLVSPSLGQ